MVSKKDSYVFGISASTAFWAEVDRQSNETGQSRSAVIVEACAELWKLPKIVSKPVGRPKRKVVKK